MIVIDKIVIYMYFHKSAWCAILGHPV